LPNRLRMFNYRACGGVSRAAKGADCKSAGLRLRRFESYLPHHLENKREKATGGPRQRAARLHLVAQIISVYFQRFPSSPGNSVQPICNQIADLDVCGAEIG
jgi:hypothetical protein